LSHSTVSRSSVADANSVEAADLPSSFGGSDFVTLHLFLDESTRHLIDATAITLMKSDAYLINTSRVELSMRGHWLKLFAVGESPGPRSTSTRSNLCQPTASSGKFQQF